MRFILIVALLVFFAAFKEGEVKDCPAALKAIATVLATSIINGI